MNDPFGFEFNGGHSQTTFTARGFYRVCGYARYMLRGHLQTTFTARVGGKGIANVMLG